MQQPLPLYDYQEQGLNDLIQGFSEKHRAQMFYACCSYGKTEVSIEMLRRAAQKIEKKFNYYDPKKNRVVMVMDRIVLVEQTSARMDIYGVSHGIYMAQHWRWDPSATIQLCSAQTLEARGEFPNNTILVIYDEAHVQRAFISKFIQENEKVKAIALSGSPFTKGLGKTYSRVVSSLTINELEERGRLAPLRVFICKEVDMTGAKKTAGEYQAEDAGKRVVKIVGDVVSNWVEKTFELFGEPKKTIMFVPDVATGQLYEKRFCEAGYNFKSISYKDEDNAGTLEEFSKPDSKYIGLIAIDILTKGYSQNDVFIGISARPFSKSFSSHVQQLGRLQRTHLGKEFGAWFDHSGNYLKFLDDWEDLKENGVSDLDDGKEKPKPEPSKEEKEAAKCKKCGHVWGKTDVCQHCGAIRERRSTVEEVGGKVEELKAPKKDKNAEPTQAEKTQFYAELLGYAEHYNKNPGSAYHQYKEKFGVVPAGKKPDPLYPSQATINWVRKCNIAYAKTCSK